MKKLIYIFIVTCFISCENFESNSNLPLFPFNINVNLSLPEYQDALIPGGSVFIHGQGIKGIILRNINGTTFSAFEASCPHLDPQNCSTMFIESGIKMVCPCDDSEFSILDGQPLTNGINEFAVRYQATLISGTIINIAYP